MLERADHMLRIGQATARSPVTALLGPRQCGKTTMARAFAATQEATFFDLESEVDLRRLANPEMALGACRGLVVLDEIQRAPNSSTSSGYWWIGLMRVAGFSFSAAPRRIWCGAFPSPLPVAWSSSS